ncbi:hypothetical protein J7E83_11245 [Arthrobacter sp. ISL-48]|uniref:hypothetical protein n=1 Tax=Arthrobacter sp. ISL-48 TaxID=2819110 RepID=UPI001BE674FD|nr:hypothetical protein [Arthrobacter sp. ISL-48]MBT2532687.1 hypothetical protein [Arthrobacter sp. ISL-48]
MDSNRAKLFTAVTTAGLAVSLVLAGCGLQVGADPAAASNMTVNDPDGPTPKLAFAPPSTAAPVALTTIAVPASVVPASTAKHEAPALKTFTFPDGHISFAYPSTWAVRTVLPPAGVPGVEAIVSDGAGNDLLSLGNGFTAGCAGGPVSRRVFDQAAVPGMAAPDGTEPLFGFVMESYPNGEGDSYFMGLSDPRSLEEGEGVASWCNLVSTENGGLSTRVLFNNPGFPNKGAANAWMATDQYAQLKALLVSLTYA